MAGKQYVYIVQRRDYEDHTDDAGRLEVVEVHANLSKANAAAEEHLAEESENALDDDPEVDQDMNSDGGYRATCYSREDERDHFDVEVIKMELKGAAAVSNSAPKAGSAMPAGKPGALSDLKVLFTGTFNMDRNTCIATAKGFGATVQTAPARDTDYVFLGSQAGPKKLEIIEQYGLETVDEQGFQQLLKNGVPQEKRNRIAARASGEPATKRQKT
ncbi:hypothetical protein LTR85_008066 [Meristemomyces frigidus]|nr:hypothetical protein LTR85_008066 [Meristemomyces frigidus]